MFEGFAEFDVFTEEISIHGDKGGSGPPLLLLHGFSQTHPMWHATAPRLADYFTVVAADLRGYARSGTPPSTADHQPCSESAMACDMIDVMRHWAMNDFRSPATIEVGAAQSTWRLTIPTVSLASLFLISFPRTKPSMQQECSVHPFHDIVMANDS